MMGPITEDDAVTAALKVLSYPSFSMAGINIEPKAAGSFPQQFMQILCPAATEIVAQ